MPELFEVISGSGVGSMQCGIDADASGMLSMAFGEGAVAPGLHGAAFGYRAKAGEESTAVGNGAQALSPKSVAIGSGANADAGAGGPGENTAVGDDAQALTEYNWDSPPNPLPAWNATMIGRQSRATTHGCAFGHGAKARGRGSFAIGSETVVEETHQGSMAWGYAAKTSRAYELVVGSSEPIRHVTIGKGAAHSSPDALTYHNTNAAGANVATKDITYEAGQSTGTGAAGRYVFRTAKAGATSGSTLNTLNDRLIIGADGVQVVGSLTIGTGATAETPTATHTLIVKDKDGRTFKLLAVEVSP